MAPIRESNAERRRERDKCRESLSEHIRQKLGIEIKPSEVRLIPRENDPYLWQVMPGKETFYAKVFTRHLSDHSTGTFRLLYQEVGKTFEAVPCFKEQPSLHSVTSLTSPGPSFSDVIDNLKMENARLACIIQDMQQRIDDEANQREHVEEENLRLRDRHGMLETQIKDSSDLVDCLKSSMTKYFVGLDKAIPILEELRGVVSEGGINGCIIV